MNNHYGECHLRGVNNMHIERKEIMAQYNDTRYTIHDTQDTRYTIHGIYATT